MKPLSACLSVACILASAAQGESVMFSNRLAATRSGARHPLREYPIFRYSRVDTVIARQRAPLRVAAEPETAHGAGSAEVPLNNGKDVPVARPRILLLAGGPNREYRFVRQFLASHPEAFEVSVHLQSAPHLGTKSNAPEIDEVRIVSKFPVAVADADRPPNVPGQGDDKKEAQLDQFDVILAVDADWQALSTRNLRDLQEWVGRHGNGLIIVAGGIHCSTLARAAPPLAAMLPVRLQDPRLVARDPSFTQCYPVRMHGSGPSLLDLDDDAKASQAAWDQFFWEGQPPKQAGQPATRGFFHCSAAEAVHPQARLLASLAADDVEHPLVLTMNYAAGRVLYVGSRELWRIREIRASYHDRLWKNLIKFAATHAPLGSELGVSDRIALGDAIIIEARLIDAERKLLKETARPVLRVSSPGSDQPARVPLVPRRSAGAWLGSFRCMVIVNEPGEYSLTLHVPGTTQQVSRKFVVEKTAGRLAPLAAKSLGAPAGRQTALARQFRALTVNMTKLVHKLEQSKIAELARDVKPLRQALETTFEVGMPTSRKLADALGTMRANSLNDVKEAAELSKTLAGNVEKLRGQLFFAGPLPALDQPLGKLLIRLPGDLANVDALAAQARDDVEHALEQLRRFEARNRQDRQNLAEQLDDLKHALHFSRLLLQARHAKCRKMLEELKAQQCRPDTLRLLEAGWCRSVDVVLPQALEQTLARVTKDGVIDDQALAQLKKDMQRSAAALEALTEFRVGSMLTTLVAIEEGQNAVTRDLQALRKRLEDDVLNDLLK